MIMMSLKLCKESVSKWSKGSIVSNTIEKSNNVRTATTKNVTADQVKEKSLD